MPIPNAAFELDSANLGYVDTAEKLYAELKARGHDPQACHTIALLAVADALAEIACRTGGCNYPS